MYNVYIITKEGRAYNDAGIEAVKDMLNGKYGINDDDMIFHQGTEFNKPEMLINCLTENPDAAIVISVTGGMYTIIGKNDHLKATIPLLRNHPDETCWETILTTIKNQSKHHN